MPKRRSTSSSSLRPFACNSRDDVSKACIDSARSNFLIWQSESTPATGPAGFPYDFNAGDLCPGVGEVREDSGHLARCRIMGTALRLVRAFANMKRIIPLNTNWIWAIPAFFLFADAPDGFAKSQKKSAGPGQGNADPLVNAALKNMETGVWSVNGTVTGKKTIKLHGLLAGEDFDLTMEPGMKPDTPLRGIVIKDKAW